MNLGEVCLEWMKLRECGKHDEAERVLDGARADLERDLRAKGVLPPLPTRFQRKAPI